MSSDYDISAVEALDALERFVVDNPALLELEARIGRFNIFDALRIVEAEIRHSNFLAWLLDPAESHGQGPLFLRAILMDLLRQSKSGQRLFSPVLLDGQELRGVIVHREWRHIDILVTCDAPRFVLVIENKIRAREGDGQLARYEELVRAHFGDIPIQFVFLTREGDEPTEKDWTVYTYRDIHTVLSRVYATNETTIGDDVGAFLEHYLRLIGSRFMDDKEIDNLCHTIYRNHRQALQLIFDRVGLDSSGVLTTVRQLIEDHHDGWRIIRTRRRGIVFAPTRWAHVFPPIGSRATYEAYDWFVFEFRVTDRGCRFMVRVWPTTNPALRQAFVDAVADPANRFKLRKTRRYSDQWTTLCNEIIIRWQEDEEPDRAELTSMLTQKLNGLLGRFDGIDRIVETAAQLANGEKNTKQTRSD